MHCKICCWLLLTCWFAGCGFNTHRDGDAGQKMEEVALSYATQFTLKKQGGNYLLTVFTDARHSAEASQTFTLVSDTTGKRGDHDHVIPIPCRRIVCVSSTQLAYFFALKDIDNIVGINSSRYLFHEEMNRRVANGEVKRIGKEGNFNLELVAALNPDVIFVSPYKAGGYDALKNMGIPLVPVAAYNEMTPLGRAEWIKMMALFVDKTREADSIFAAIEQRYNELKDRVAGVKHRPTVFSGKLRSGAWYVPGGASFFARFFRDAGAQYVIDDDEQRAYPVGFETIYQKAHDADFWRVVNPEKKGISLEEFLAQDVRYADFKAAAEGNIFLCNIREKPYYEQAAVKPDVILADYIHFFHPQLLPDYEPFFYEKLK